MEFKIKERIAFDVNLEESEYGRKKTIKFLRNLVKSSSIENSESQWSSLDPYNDKNLNFKSMKYYPVFSAKSSDGRIMGACASELYQDGLIRVDLLAVDSKYKRQGVGLSLLKKIVDFARKNKIHNIQCLSPVLNKESKKFLKKAGFRKVGKLKKYFGKQDYYLWEYLP
ncbi:GNAT family N-acetyltransferase [Candidatus Parvarchaeota archaeon]|nr:GNAT family N-acetyltransferase [Candidatus Parvarchaeota archaeon]